MTFNVYGNREDLSLKLRAQYDMQFITLLQNEDSDIFYEQLNACLAYFSLLHVLYACNNCLTHLLLYRYCLYVHGAFPCRNSHWC